VILVNPTAGGGRGVARWAAVARALPRDLAAGAVVCPDLAAARAALARAVETHPALLAAASGDGGVNLALNAVMDPATDRPRWEVALGAIGLGSSNDFHKPRDPAHDLAGVPVALDVGRAAAVDVGRVDWEDVEGRPGMAYFLLNASFGATARGNWRYNHPTGVLAWLKRHAGPDAAIAWATLEAIAAFAPVPATLALDGGPPERADVANLGIVKRVHFAGDLRYDTPVAPDDGAFAVNLARDLGRAGFLRAVLGLARGRFLAQGSARLTSRRAAHVVVRPDVPAPLEYDGEVALVREATLRVVPRAIRLAGPGTGGPP
jgi:diacylglycerol kinase family enzyme